MIIYVRVKRARCMNINERSSLFPSRSFVDIPPRLLISQPGFQFLLHFLTRVWQTREARTMREGDYEDVKGVFTIQVTGTPRILNSFELATFSTIIIPLYFSFSSAKRIWSSFFSRRKFSKSVDYRFLSLFKRRRLTRIDSKRIRIERMCRSPGKKKWKRGTSVSIEFDYPPVKQRRRKKPLPFFVLHLSRLCNGNRASRFSQREIFSNFFKDEIASFELPECNSGVVTRTVLVLLSSRSWILFSLVRGDEFLLFCNALRIRRELLLLNRKYLICFGGKNKK